MLINPHINKKIDPVLFIVIILLVLIGISSVYSASFIYAEKLTGDSLYFFKKHVIALLPALLLFTAGIFINPDLILKFFKPLIFLSIILLLAVLIPGIGKKVSGARRWIYLGFIKMQPSSIAKFAIIVYLSMVLTLKGEKIAEFRRGILPPLFIILIAAALIVIEPDISTAAFILFISLFMFYAAGIPLLHIITVGTVSLPFMVMLLETKQYLWKRFFIINPYEDPYGKGYHLIQSFKSFRIGGFFGIGPGNSIQKVSNLPEAHTDFIFSVIGEETGVVGCSFILVLFLLLFHRGIEAAKNIEDRALSLLAFGISISIAFQALLHILVVTGLLPTTGMPLPFISYGRTSLIINLFMAGLLTNLSRYKTGEQK